MIQKTGIGIISPLYLKQQNLNISEKKYTMIFSSQSIQSQRLNLLVTLSSRDKNSWLGYSTQINFS